MFKRHLKNTNKYGNCSGKADDRVACRKVVVGAEGAIQRKNKQLWTVRRLRKLESAPPPMEVAYKCDTCIWTFRTVIGLSLHMQPRY